MANKTINQAISDKCTEVNQIPCMACDIDDCCPRQERGFKDSSLNNRVKEAVEAAELAFWDEVVRHFPEAKSGDLDPMLTFCFTDMTTKVVNSWVENNVEIESPRIYDITFVHTSVLKGEYVFGTFTGKHETHAHMTKAAQSMMKNFQALYGGCWDYSWDSKRAYANTRPVGSI